MTEKIVQYPEIPNIPEDPEKVKIYGYDPDREAAYAEMEQESFEKNPFLIPGYIYKDHKMIPIPRIKKRIGSKLYDTDSSEPVCTVEDGILFRKRTREREWFIVTEEEKVIPLTETQAAEALGNIVIEERKPTPTSIMVRVDRETHKVIADEAKRRGISMTEAIHEMILG